MLLILTFDLHDAKNNAHRTITKELGDIGLKKSVTPKNGKRKLPDNTYSMKIENEDDAKSIRSKYYKKVKKIIEAAHDGESDIFLFIGRSWGYRIGRISN